MSIRRLSQPALLGVLALGFLAVLVLAFAGGGYGPQVRAQVGVVVWWTLLVGVVLGLLPLRYPGKLAISSAIVLALFVLWTGLSLIWTESGERTMADLGRTATYLGIFLLALALRSSNGVRRMVTAVGSAIVVVAILALASRIFPAWFPEAVETARTLPESAGRLAYPLDYWNGLGALVAIGIPLILHLATTVRSALWQGLAAAALPVLSLTLFLTYSRSGVLAAILAVLIYFAMAPDRIGRFFTLVIAGVASAVLIFAAEQNAFVADGPVLTQSSTGEGFVFLALMLVTCLLTGLAQVAIHRGIQTGKRPEWTYPTRRVATYFLAGAGAIAVVLLAGLLLTGKPGEAWDDFTSPATVSEQGSARLQTLNGNNRYQFWEEAIDQYASAPVIGRGSGSFEFWTNRSVETTGFVRDAHSLVLETMGELGLVGVLLLLSFLGLVVGGGVLRTVRSSSKRRSQMAAALAGCSAFVVAAMVDWTWELAVVPIVFMLLASTLVTAGDSSTGHGRGLSQPLRASIGFVAIGAIVVISIPMVSSSLVRESQRAASDGDLRRSLTLARKAGAVEPAAASPLVQQALIWEAAGRPEAGLDAAREATEKESTNWRTWLIRSRLEAESGHAEAAIESFREAKRLNPTSTILGGRLDPAPG